MRLLLLGVALRPMKTPTLLPGRAQYYYGDDLTGTVSRGVRDAAPGERWRYSEADVQVLGFVIEAAVGVNAAMALRLLGVAPGVPPRELKRFVPFMWFGFWLNTISGLLLLLAYPTKALTNPVFYLKIFLIAAGMWLYTKMGRLMFGSAETTVGQTGFTGRRLAIASLSCWAACSSESAGSKGSSVIS